MSIQDSDNLIIGRGGSVFKTTYQDLKQKLIDDGIGGGGGGGTVVDFPPSTIPGASLALSSATLSSDNQKIEFSLDSTDWFDVIGPTQPASTIQTRWKIDAHDATPQDAETTTQLTYDIVNGPTYVENYKYKVDKVPQQFDFGSVEDTIFGAYVEAPNTMIVSNVNARFRAWATTDGPDVPQIFVEEYTAVRNYSTRIQLGQWVNLPTTPDDSVLVPVNSTIKLRHKTKLNTQDVTTTELNLGWDTDNVMTTTFTTTNMDTFLFNPEFVLIGGGGKSYGVGNQARSGGGAGGYLSNVVGEMSGGGASALGPITMVAVTGLYDVTVGANSQNSKLNNTNSPMIGIESAFDFTALAGGTGTATGATVGGSGGGAASEGGNQVGAAGTSGQGFAGSDTGNSFTSTCYTEKNGCYSSCPSTTRYGAGGGAGGAANGTDGGAGVQSSITGTPTYYAGGGYSTFSCNGTKGTGGEGYLNAGGGGVEGLEGQLGALIIRYPDLLNIENPDGNLTLGSTTIVGNQKVTTITAGTGQIKFNFV